MLRSVSSLVHSQLSEKLNALRGRTKFEEDLLKEEANSGKTGPNAEEKERLLKLRHQVNFVLQNASTDIAPSGCQGTKTDSTQILME
jgi:hypothetical protein